MRGSNKLALAYSIGAMVTLICYALGALLSGGGHSYFAMILFFPMVMLVDLAFSPPSWLFLPLLFSQFTIYIFIFQTILKKQELVIRCLILLGMHVTAVIICFGIDSPRK
jgi:hypothetical protein